MKGVLLKFLRTEPILRRRDIILTLLPLLLWITAVHLRTDTMKLSCIASPKACVPEEINPVDRQTVHIENPTADILSFVTQDLTAGVAFLTPLAIQARFALQGAPPYAAAVTAGIDLVILMQSVFWNGFLTEAGRLAVQRPRPFVYKNPQELGRNPAHYTSFYSGHTSFVAASSSALVYIVFTRAPWLWLKISSVLFALVFIFLTGLFRVLAGRHFISDVAFAAFAGIVTSTWIAFVHRPKNKTQ